MSSSAERGTLTRAASVTKPVLLQVGRLQKGRILLKQRLLILVIRARLHLLERIHRHRRTNLTQQRQRVLLVQRVERVEVHAHCFGHGARDHFFAIACVEAYLLA